VRRGVLRQNRSLFHRDREQQDVAIKDLNSYLSSLRLLKAFASEIRVWARIEHPNILPFLGLHFRPRKSIGYLVFPWLPNGNVTQYLKSRPKDDAERLGLARDATEGLRYLHHLNPPICHGSIKAANTLVHSDGHAMLCDVGLAKALEGEETQDGLMTLSGFKGSVRWISPEVLNGQARSIASDVWAWGFLILEIMTGKVPYHTVNADIAVIACILEGTLPKEDDFAEVEARNVPWDLLDRCWHRDTSTRVDIDTCCRDIYTRLLNLEAQRASHT